MKCVACKKREAIMVAKIDGEDCPICEKCAGEPVQEKKPMPNLIEEIANLKTEKPATKKYSSVDDMMKSIEAERIEEEKTILGWLYYNIWLPITWRYEKVEFFIRNTFPGYFRRARKGYARHDLWNLDYYLANLLENSIRELSEDVHGHPCDLNSLEEWQEILCQISNTFHQAKQVMDSEIILTNTKSQYKRMKAMVDKNPEVWEKTIVYTPAETKEFYKGFDLFKKYFFGMWD